MAETTYDAVIIGVGQAGNPLASALAKAGKRVALLERDAVGGHASTGAVRRRKR